MSWDLLDTLDSCNCSILWYRTTRYAWQKTIASLRTHGCTGTWHRGPFVGPFECGCSLALVWPRFCAQMNIWTFSVHVNPWSSMDSLESYWTSALRRLLACGFLQIGFFAHASSTKYFTSSRTSSQRLYIRVVGLWELRTTRQVSWLPVIAKIRVCMRSWLIWQGCKSGPEVHGALPHFGRSFTDGWFKMGLLHFARRYIFRV